MKKFLLFAMVAALLLVPSVVFADTVDTPTSTVITATGTDNTLTYQDTGLVLQPTEEGTSIPVTVVSMFGFNNAIAQPGDQNTTAGVPVYYNYVITNEGNASDTYGVSYSAVYYDGAANWIFNLYDVNGTATLGATADTVYNAGPVTEDADYPFYLAVLPSLNTATESSNGANAIVTVTITTDAVPVGVYDGANANVYGGTWEASDATQTTISAGVMTLTRTATVDAPDDYIVNKGGAGHHDAVPGAVITYTITVSNEGSNDAKNVIIADRVPTDTTGAHISAESGSEGSLVNVEITAGGQTNAGDWAKSYSTTDTDPGLTYGETANWTALTSSLLINDIAAGYYVKFENETVQPGEFAIMNWGVTIQ
ncbi:hypothetical protein ACFL4F_01290 [Candidatus Margulisiibacteriota bacterium]